MTEMVLPNNEAITASFMVIGMSSNDDDLYDRLLKRWDRGCFELHYELCHYATLSEQIIKIVTKGDENYDFPGVYDYAVSEEFGRWFRKHILETGEAPDFERAKMTLVAEACRFFTQGEQERFDLLIEHVTKELG